jgi:FkbM family methyltransferase
MILLASLFRSLNARLITTDNAVGEKILKFFFALSLIVYRYERKKKRKSETLVINNFDGNIKMQIDRSRSMGASLYWTGFHEFRELLFLERYLKSDMTFVDIGANQGEYSLFAAKRLSKGIVLAFEPLPSIRTVLNENISLNGFVNIRVFDFGLSDKSGQLVLHEIEDVHEGLATSYLGERKSKSTMTISLKSLDEVMLEFPLLKVDVMKIDIEGGELNALKGSERTIEKFKPVILIEINEATYRAAGYSTKDVENFFQEKKYIPYQIGKRGKLIKCNTLPELGNIVYKPA